MNNKILLVASSGGHWVQLMRMMPAFENKYIYFCSTLPQEKENFFLIGDVSRNNVFSLPSVFFRCFRILLDINPDCVVTTGALPGLLMIICGKILRKRTVWIDSVANCDKISGSGMLAKYFSDHWITQWQHLSGNGKDRPKYIGSVL